MDAWWINQKAESGFLHQHWNLAIKVGALTLDIFYMHDSYALTLNKVFLGFGFGYDFIIIFEIHTSTL